MRSRPGPHRSCRVGPRAPSGAAPSPWATRWPPRPPTARPAELPPPAITRPAEPRPGPLFRNPVARQPPRRRPRRRPVPPPRRGGRTARDRGTRDSIQGVNPPRGAGMARPQVPGITDRPRVAPIPGPARPAGRAANGTNPMASWGRLPAGSSRPRRPSALAPGEARRRNRPSRGGSGGPAPVGPETSGLFRTNSWPSVYILGAAPGHSLECGTLPGNFLRSGLRVRPTPFGPGPDPPGFGPD